MEQPHDNPAAARTVDALPRPADGPPPANLPEAGRLPPELANFEPPPAWSPREYENAKMELMATAGLSTGTAYLIWFFFGMHGGHRFYLGEMRAGLITLGLFAASLTTMILLIGFVGFFALFVWWVIDLFRINGLVDAHNRRVATLAADVASGDQSRPLPAA